jgi:tetratricopeptide (TPR) repeat protein
MNNPFDPFHKWLGIPPEEQPASYYRLLGIPELEPDLEVIEAAVEQRTIYLRTFKTGNHSQLAEQLLNMISSAQVCLLNSQTKVRYDNQLRASHEAKLARNAPPPAPSNRPLVVQTAGSNAVATADKSATSTAGRVRQRRKKSRNPAIIIGSAGICMILAIVVYMAMEGDQEKPYQPPKPPVVAENLNSGSGTAGDNSSSDIGGDPGDNSSSDTGGDPGDNSSSDTGGDPGDNSSSDTGGTSGTDIPESEKMFNEAWVVVFDALAERDLEEARQQLMTLEELATTRTLRDKFNRLDLLRQYVEIYENLWSQSVAKLRGGEELKYGANEILAVVEVTPLKITIKARGQLKTYLKTKMSSGLEFAIIETYFDMSQAGSLMAAGSHYATHLETTDVDIKKAREYWSRAVDINPSLDDLSVVLEDSDSRPSLIARENNSGITRAGMNVDEKIAIPDKEEIDKHFQALSELFETELASARSPALKASLATFIFDLSKENTSSNEELYAILMFSYDLARDSGEEPLTNKIRNELDETFAIDILSMRLEECRVWESLIPMFRLADEHAEAYHDLAKILEEIGTLAVDAANYSVAILAFEQGLKLNQRSNMEAHFSTLLKASLDKAKLSATRYKDFAQARDVLVENPDDAEANLKVGKFLAFNQDSWPEALPHLARGSDPLLRQMAQAEQKKPTESPMMESLGDLWRDYGALPATAEEDRPSTYHRAIFWYQQAAANSASTIRKLGIEKKIDALPQFEFNLPEEGLVFFFPFDGTINDTSPYQHSSQLEDANFIKRQNNGAILLDGKNNLSVDYHFSFRVDNEFTLSALVALDKELPSSNQWPQVLGQRITPLRSALDLGLTKPEDGVPFRWRASISNGDENNEIAQEIQSNAIVKPGTWTHLVYTVNRIACELWIDGKLDQRVVRDPKTIDNIGSSVSDFTIGSNGYSGSLLNWVGGIDNVRFYDRSLKAREIKSLFQVDAGVGVQAAAVDISGDTPASELTTSSFSLKFDSPIYRFRVAIPDGVSKDNLSLRITEFIGFDAENRTSGGIAVAGKDQVILLKNSPSNVKFRIKLSLLNDEAFIMVRPTFRLIETSSKDSTLTTDQLQKSIKAIMLSVAKGNNEKAYYLELLPDIESQVRSLNSKTDDRSRVLLGVAFAKYNQAQTRIRSLNSSLPKSIRRLERLKNLQTTLTQLQGTATVHFEVLPTP